VLPEYSILHPPVYGIPLANPEDRQPSGTIGFTDRQRGRRGYRTPMPLTVFDCTGISATRRERIEAAVEAGGRHAAQPYEGWIAADPFRGGIRVLITGPQGFERTVTFALDEGAATITQRVKETIDD
jgi:hypothetical protein